MELKPFTSRQPSSTAPFTTNKLVRRSTAGVVLLPAMVTLGLVYVSGQGGLLGDQAGAATVNLVALYADGQAGQPAGDDAEAVKRYRKAAEGGDTAAMADLGFMYATGRGGLAEDKAEAARWFRKAADAGHAGGMFNLGLLIARGQGGLAKDEAEAARWFRKAADAGDAEGVGRLGMAYIQGRGGLPVDREKGIELLRKAAGAGNSWSRDQLRDLGIP